MVNAWRLTIVTLLLVLGSVAFTGEQKNMSKEGWKLVWSDEFNGDGAVNFEEWAPRIGFIRNNEEQFYIDDIKNLFQKDGLLNIVCMKDPGKRVQPAMRGNAEKEVDVKYTSAEIDGKRGFLYGRIEARAKIPTGKGSWPAVWMLGKNIRTPGIGWPMCGEIDIMENIGKDPLKIHGTLHWKDKKTGKHKSNGKSISAQNPWEGFHIYAVEWDEDKIDFFYDDTKYHTINLDDIQKGPENPFRKPQFLLINLALGGSWGGKVDTSILPLVYQLDYIRVYQKKEAK